MLSNTRILARSAVPAARARVFFSTTPRSGKWEGRQADENTTREKDTHNAQQDAVRDGKAERAAGESGSSGATSEKAGGAGHADLNEKAKKEHPEAPGPVIGMNDERGGVSFLPLFSSLPLFSFSILYLPSLISNLFVEGVEMSL